VKTLRPKLTFANVVSCLALFVALSGSAYAAAQLKKNSVGSKQIKANAVTTAKIKKGAVTGAKIELSSLGTVPSAAVANSLPAAEPAHIVGTPGEPQFENGSTNFSPAETKEPPIRFYKDHDGIVHLEGYAAVGSIPASELVPIFTLPAGYRPAPGTALLFPEGEGALVFGVGTAFAGETHNGSVVGEKNTDQSLNGITFRAEG
jgi:hypothetical protein